MIKVNIGKKEEDIRVDMTNIMNRRKEVTNRGSKFDYLSLTVLLVLLIFPVSILILLAYMLVSGCQ